MKTIFEDTALKAQREEASFRGNERGYTLPILWLVAMLSLAGVWRAYIWAEKQAAIEPPAPPASLEDDMQTSRAITKFNIAVLEGKWADAEAMLSTAAKQRLTSENKSLTESLLGKFKDYKIVGGEITQSVDRSEPNMLRIDSLYKFSNDPSYARIEQRVISLVLIIEDNKLKIDNWSRADSDERNQEGGAGVSQ
jgi:hypothetical protein